ncbi:MAG TPA: hypothetical protein VJ783_13455 [Pirellulales bacterium]|nr:hypothetical protein [Pirellulales bacterium]
MISQSERDRERYESHLKLQRDIYTALAEKLDEGIEKGRAEARRDDVRNLQEMLGQDVMSDEELQALPLPELERIASRLRAELKSRLTKSS